MLGDEFLSPLQSMLRAVTCGRGRLKSLYAFAFSPEGGAGFLW
jgi:hypothetical protein